MTDTVMVDIRGEVAKRQVVQGADAVAEAARARPQHAESGVGDGGGQFVELLGVAAQ